jgi:hypothetical protein
VHPGSLQTVLLAPASGTDQFIVIDLPAALA